MKKITDPVEALYLALMIRWEKTAPPDRNKGLLDGVPERNTQISRLVFVLQKIAAGEEDRVFSTLERYNRRKDGIAFISKLPSSMRNPRELSADWYYEGCMNMEDKAVLVGTLRKLRLSSEFIQATEDFVANRSVIKYMPTKEEIEIIIAKLDANESKIVEDKPATCV